MRMRRRWVATGVGVVAAVAFGWWWTRPNPAWACQADGSVTCASLTSVFDDAHPHDPWRVAFRGFTVSPDERFVAVVLERWEDDASGRPATEPSRTELVVHDLAPDRSPDRTRTEPVVISHTPDGAPIRSVEGLSFVPTSSSGGDDSTPSGTPPGGSLVVALVVDEDEGRLAVIDPAVGAITTEIDSPVVVQGCNEFGVTPAGHPQAPAVQCSDALLDLTTGGVSARVVDPRYPSAPDPSLPDTGAIAGYRGSGLAVAVDGDKAWYQGNEIDLTPDLRSVPLDPPRSSEWNWMFYRDDLVGVATDELATSWWRTPRRNRPGGTVIWVDAAALSVIASTETAWEADFIVPLSGTRVAVLDQDGHVWALAP
ncbi:MAG: hypothetical protein ACK5PP_03180 [Acidimicrobiales bacterium]